MFLKNTKCGGNIYTLRVNVTAVNDLGVTDWLLQSRHGLQLPLSTAPLAFTVRVHSWDEIVKSRHVSNSSSCSLKKITKSAR
jgi:hypothetical protein